MSASCGNPLDDDFIIVEINMFSVNTVFSGHHLRTRTESSHRWLHRRTRDSCLPTSVRRITFHEDSKFFRLNETISNLLRSSSSLHDLKSDLSCAPIIIQIFSSTGKFIHICSIIISKTFWLDYSMWTLWRSHFRSSSLPDLRSVSTVKSRQEIFFRTLVDAINLSIPFLSRNSPCQRLAHDDLYA